MSQNIRSADSISNADVNRVAGGHKANLSNDHTSEKSKQHSRAQLEEIEASGRLGHTEGDKNMGNVLGGHKATISNPKVGEQAKEHARKVLREHDALDEQYA